MIKSNLSSYGEAVSHALSSSANAILELRSNDATIVSRQLRCL